jgi:threonine dehydrogenase-like Zn-dependent dehydrogenase
MKQMVQSYRSGEMNLLEVPPPVCKPQGYLVKTAVSLVSAGTEKMIVDLARKSLVGKAASRPDLVRQVVDKVRQEGLKNTAHKVFSKLNQPIPLGYSLAGSVLETGGLAKDILPGSRVACAGAGYASHAEMNYVPQNLVVPVPDEVSDEAASFVTLGAIALQGVRRLGPKLGEKVAVLGLGLLGQITVQLLKANGCQVIGSDLDPAKIELAQSLGADRSVKVGDLAEAAEGFSRGRGLDGVIITASTSSSEPVVTAGNISRMGGRVVVVGMVGMVVPRNLYYSKELDLALSMSYGPGRYDPEFEERGHDYPFAHVRWTEQRNMEAFLDLLATKRMDVSRLITHRFPIDRVQDAYALFEQKEVPYLGIVLQYPEAPQTASKIELTPAKPARHDAVGVGMIGAGNFSRGVLLPALAKNRSVELVCLAAAGGLNARTSGENFGFRSVTSQADEVINHPDVDTVFITTPHQMHAEQVQTALRAGKHVFVEKPLAINPEQLQGICDTLQGTA